MKTYLCDHCQEPLFFEDTQCRRCGSLLAYLPDLDKVGVLTEKNGAWRSPRADAAPQGYRLCRHFRESNICNEAIVADAPFTRCHLCRFTEITPELSQTDYLPLWARLVEAQRRALHTVRTLGLPLVPREDDPEDGLVFQFRHDGHEPLATHYAAGVITVSVHPESFLEDGHHPEALLNPAERSPTLLGDFRHQLGHYFREQLIDHQPQWVSAFEDVFGQETQNHPDALACYRLDGPPENWEEEFVSALAGAHPWEDWAETWAFYLQLIEVVETGSHCGIAPPTSETDPLQPRERSLEWDDDSDFLDELLRGWTTMARALNGFHRSLGLQDACPLFLPGPVRDKLAFVHQRVLAAGA